ncbi:MAG: ATP-binding protein [Pseudomonadota bacterium]|nr:ATP-binding protein [Pseudomonadota bacterium]
MSFGGFGTALGDVVWVAVAAGTACAALLTFALFLRNRRDDRLAGVEGEVMALRAELDRTEALLEADDQRTVVWESVAAPAQVFGGLPERVGAPADKSAFLAFAGWLSPESFADLDSCAEKLRRSGQGFQIAARTRAGALVEVTGRTSGRRSLIRFRELTGERRSFAELKEQASYVVNEMTGLRALADILPFPLWRRNRIGRLTWVNTAYVQAVEAASQDSVLQAGIELLPSRAREAIREVERAGAVFRDSATAIVAGDRRRLQVLDMTIEDGTIGCAIDVSEVDAIGDELRRTTESNARTLDQLAAGVAVFDKTGRIRFHNTAFRTLWDVSPGFLDTAPEEGAILDQLRADRKLPEQANYRDWRAKHIAAYRSGEPREEWWYLPDRRTLRMVAMPNADGGMTYIYENVTEQLSLESRLKALLQLQGETLDHLTEAVAVFGTDGRLRLFNPVFANIWRLSPTTLREEPHIGEIIADCQGIYADPAPWADIRKAVTDLEHEDQATGRMQRPDGSVIDYATVALPEGMTMLTFVDVTDSARIQRVLRERNEALEAADRLKSDFIQHVSYELRSPLTTIIGFSEMLSDETVGGLNPRQREYMDHIDSSSRALLALINDILDLATVDAGIMSLDIREADVASVAAAAVEGLQDRLREQKITLEMAFPDDLGAFHVDEQRVRQILFNLVSNAIRFSNAGGHVRVEGATRGKWVTLTVTDDGVGIPPDVMPSIFQPFEAHGAQGKRRGAGLGLSIVKSLVDLHGGEVDIRSEDGKGTTATVRLPVMPAAAAVAAE